MDLSVACQLVMTKNHIKTSFFRHIVVKESISPWRELCVEYIMVWMTELQPMPEPWCCPFKTWLHCRQETSAYLPDQVSSEHGVLRSEGNAEGLRAEIALKPMHFGSHPNSLSYELMGKDKLNWKKPSCKQLLEEQKIRLTEYASKRKEV